MVFCFLFEDITTQTLPEEHANSSTNFCHYVLLIVWAAHLKLQIFGKNLVLGNKLLNSKTKSKFERLRFNMTECSV